MATVISKEEFLKACNQKLAIDNQKQEEERRRQEEERKTTEKKNVTQYEKKKNARRTRRRRIVSDRHNAEWDAWYRTSLPASCKRRFYFIMALQYSVDKSKS